MKLENRGRPRDYDREKEAVSSPGFGVRPGDDAKFDALLGERRFEDMRLKPARGAMPRRPPALERGSAS